MRKWVATAVAAAGAVLCLAVVSAAGQKADTDLVPGKRLVRAVQYPPDLKVKFQLHSTGRAEGALGTAEVRRRKKSVEVEVDIDSAPPASQLSPGYRGYVVWALTPDGKFINLGSIERNGSLKTTTNLPTFALVVSAESDLSVQAVNEPDAILESAYPQGKWRIYPMHRVLYTPRKNEARP